MLTKRMKPLLVLLILIALITACDAAGQPAETLQSTSVVRTPRATLVLPGEFFRISGQGAGVADETFTLDEEMRIRLHWQQSSQGKFVLVLFNLDPQMEETPYGRVTFEYVIGPSEGYSDWDLVAGEFGIEVIEGDGPWDVWVQEITVEGE